MRKLRVTLIGALTIGSLAGGSVQVAAQDGETNAPVPFSTVWEGERRLGSDGFLLNILETSDPRLGGTGTIRWNETSYPDTDGSGTYELSHYTVRIENNEGAWQGSALDFEGSAAEFDGVELEALGTFVVVGEGDYAGLYAVMVDLDGWNDIKGVILSAPPPEAPAPAEIP
jgi:hypothetical protein